MTQQIDSLAPAQQRALDSLLQAARPGNVIALVANPGNGRTTVLGAAQKKLGGRWLGAADLQRAISTRHPLAVEDSLYELASHALAEDEIVFIDDLNLVLRAVEGCHMYPRGGLVQLAIKAEPSSSRRLRRSNRSRSWPSASRSRSSRSTIIVSWCRRILPASASRRSIFRKSIVSLGA